jgi:anion-transporting  ArsA/GET3 family ATPase
MSSEEILSRVIICVGAGGVGKTTIASVLGLHFAAAGYKTLVITIDPAQRLLDALSLDSKAPQPKKVMLGKLIGKNRLNGGELFVLMPDLKREWMDFLQASIHNADLRHEITSNHFYQYMADGLPGAFEIICAHVLFRVMKSGDYDRVILDTPPSSHSMSFLDMPKKISSVLEQNIFRSLINRRHSFLIKLTKKLAFISGGLLDKTLEKVIGSHFLSEMIDFALTIDALYDPMLERTKAAEELLFSKNTKYVLVCRPTSASIKDCAFLRHALTKRGINPAEIIVNQVMPEVDKSKIKQERLAVTTTLEAEEAKTIEQLLSLYEEELRYEKKLIARLKKDFFPIDVYELPLTVARSPKSEIISELLCHYQQRIR